MSRIIIILFLFVSFSLTVIVDADVRAADDNDVWTLHDINRSWSSVASSSDGGKLVGVVLRGRVYTTGDSMQH
ncbi:MAG TPA: hypothetical protein VMB78_08865 [Dissulfurispiraceae bacterium]|nr:hypothetical protein [Dissulfurispiraceae bacterium]